MIQRQSLGLRAEKLLQEGQLLGFTKQWDPTPRWETYLPGAEEARRMNLRSKGQRTKRSQPGNKKQRKQNKKDREGSLRIIDGHSLTHIRQKGIVYYIWVLKGSGLHFLRG